MRSFTFSEAVEFSGATRSQAINLAAKRVVIPDVEDTVGTGNHRRFSLFNVFELKVAAELIPLGVEHYAIAQILRGLRWVIGDPRGLETWFDTFRATPEKQRARFDRRLLRAQLVERVNRISTELADSDLDVSSMSEEDQAFVMYARSRMKEIESSQRPDAWTLYRDLGGLFREMPLVRRGAGLWELLKSRETRKPLFLLAWPEYHGGEYKRLTAAGWTANPWEGWVIRLAEPNEIPTIKAISDGSAVVMVYLLPLIEQLEADTGERFDDAERERAATWASGSVGKGDAA